MGSCEMMGPVIPTSDYIHESKFKMASPVSDKFQNAVSSK